MQMTYDYEHELEQSASKVSIPLSNRPKFMREVFNKHQAKSKVKKSQKKSKPKNQPQIIQSINLIGDYFDRIQKYSQAKLQKKVVQLNGKKIEGKWKNNLLHGYAIIDYQSGQHFQGNYHNGTRIEGMIQFKNGTQYLGAFSQNLFHGLGTLIDSNKRVIMCKWNKGKPEQKVKIKYPSGDVYYGEVKQLQKHGHGYLFFNNGSKYVGEFYQGEITGRGAYYENDVQIVQGNWKNGLLLTKNDKERISLEGYRTGKSIRTENQGDYCTEQTQPGDENEQKQQKKQKTLENVNYECKSLRRHGFIDND